MDYILYCYVAAFGCYNILVAYFGSKILVNCGRSKRFWFALLFMFSFYLLAIVLIVPSFRRRLRPNGVKKIVVLELCYVVLILLPIFFRYAT